MTNAPPSGEGKVFALSDVRKLLRRKKKKIIRTLLIGAICGLGAAISQVPKYKIEATFKEGKDYQRSEIVSFEQLFGGAAGRDTEGQINALMQSNQVLKPLVMRLGMQAIVQKNGILCSYYRRFRDCLLAELGKQIDDLDPFVFQDVQYNGTCTLVYTLRFDDPEHFSILEGKKALAKGSIGKEVHLPNASLTLAATPKCVHLGRSYRLHIVSWRQAAESVRSNLQIAPSKISKSISVLSFKTPDRHLGVRLLNELMTQYREFLKRDHDQMVQDQLVYLEQKQEEVYKKLSVVFDDYTEYLRKNLGDHGFVELKQEIKSLSAAYDQLSNRIQAIDLELSRIALMEKEGKISVASDASLFCNEIQKITYAIQDLRQQRDLVELSLQQNKAPAYADTQYQERKEELEKIRERRNTAKRLLDAVEHGSSLSASHCDFNESLIQWAARLDESQGEERKDLAEYIENYLRLLSMQEKIAQERIFYEEDISPELQGIDLAAASALFVEYNNRLDGHLAAMSHFDQLGEEILKNGFAISSLSTVLSDPLSQQLIAEASGIVLQLKDEKHRSEKEGERWKEELWLQKKILTDHLEQLSVIEHLKADLIREKIRELQCLRLDCMNGQISVLSERLSDSLRGQRTVLIQEKKILESKQEELRSSFAGLPDLWRREKWMELKKEMGVKMIASVTDLVESKTMGRHLHHIESKALDPAILPSGPCRPGLFAFSFLGAILASFGVVCQMLLSAIFRGFPVSSETLRSMRYPFLGEITSFCDGPAIGDVTGPDLELLRQISLFLERPPQSKIVGLLTGKGPDYSYAIGETFARMGRRSLIVRCDFGATFRSEDQPGVLQIWKEETADLPIRKEKGYDWIASGGFTPYGTEIIRSDAFRRLLASTKQNYDAVFLLLSSPLDTAEPIAALSVCEKAIVTATAEPTEQLTPFFDWAYHEGNCRLAFILERSTG